MWLSVYKCVQVHMYVCVGQSSFTEMSVPVTRLPSFWDRLSPWIWSSLICLEQLSWKLRRSSFLISQHGNCRCITTPSLFLHEWQGSEPRSLHLHGKHFTHVSRAPSSALRSSHCIYGQHRDFLTILNIIYLVLPVKIKMQHIKSSFQIVEIAHQERAATLPEDLNSNSSTEMVANNLCNSISLFSPPQLPGTHTAPRNTCRQNIHTHRIKVIYILELLL